MKPFTPVLELFDGHEKRYFVFLNICKFLVTTVAATLMHQ